MSAARESDSSNRKESLLKSNLTGELVSNHISCKSYRKRAGKVRESLPSRVFCHLQQTKKANAMVQYSPSHLVGNAGDALENRPGSNVSSIRHGHCTSLDVARTGPHPGALPRLDSKLQRRPELFWLWASRAAETSNSFWPVSGRGAPFWTERKLRNGEFRQQPLQLHFFSFQF